MPRPPAPDDDAALRWDELDDPSYVESDAAIAARAAAEAGDDDESRSASLVDGAADAGTEPAAPERPAAGLRLLTGLFAVVYLAWSVGWIISIGLVPLSGPTVLLEVLYQFSEFLAIIASALWFAAVVSLTRDGRAAHRIGWLALGTLVLVPWPVVLGVIA